MNRCSRCIMPDTRPDTPFVDGVCQPCLTYAARPEIDWEERRRQLEDLLERHKNPSGYDCIVPSSGGKDSHYQVLKLIEMGARPLVVTASTCHLTPIGRMNIDNLARYATTIEVTPERNRRAHLNRLALEMVGDISWPEHVAIFTIPFQVAARYGIKLMFYGENPQNQYGGPPGTDQALQMTRRWRSEFGGFLGLRPDDLFEMGFDMREYELPSEAALDGIEAHFLGQYLPWDSHQNARVATEAGMQHGLDAPSTANWWPFENLDNAQTGLHDFGAYLKYGYSRLTAQLSVDIRTGRMNRETALLIAEAREYLFPDPYAGVHLGEILQRLQMTRYELWRDLAHFRRPDLRLQPWVAEALDNPA